ncbi:MAG: hypothetical protein QM831_24075 [Kofleriaceae bacterium]
MNLRDRFFTPGDRAALLRDVDADTSPAAAIVEGLALHWHPTRSFKALRFVEAKKLPAILVENCARPCVDAPELCAVFADPRELSFRTFENIIPLDRVFDGVTLSLDRREKPGDGVWTFQLSPCAALDRLDAMNLYVPPMDPTSRGGERAIFHSAALAEALTHAFEAALPKALKGGFQHVNPVFRLNRFEPGDAKFHRHFDTPYFDASRNQVSKYTVLIYLTGGHAEPALDVIDRVQLRDIAPYTVVMFEQKHAHEGAPYLDGCKVFLRTELIFEEREATFDPGIAALFAKATYLTGESVFEPELARVAADYYNRVAEAHWTGPVAAGDQVFVHKTYKGAQFVSNGYDYWFGKSLSLQECAALTLLDYFNCKIDGAAFRSTCKTRVVKGPEFADAVSALKTVDKARLLAPAEEADGAVCCPFHTYEDTNPPWDPTRCADVIEIFTQARSFAEAHIANAPIVMMGETVALDPAAFVISPGRIDVKTRITPVNFAACWNSGGTPDNYVGVDSMIEIVEMTVPPILFVESDDGYHLMFDFFRNGWMVEHQQAKMPIPAIRSIPEDEMDDEGGGDSPWFDACDPVFAKQSSSSTPAWWARDSTHTAIINAITEHREYAHEGEDDDDDE